MSDEEHLPKPGEVLAGKYRIEKIIGKGGMGAVLAAQHELLGQRIAIKFLLGEIAQNPEAVARFNNEARNAFKIQSEHVCRVMDVGTERGMPFMVMEFLEGQDLSQILEQRGAFPVEDAVDYVLQGLEAIAQAHALGIVHRDLKPANLFLHRRTDGSTLVKVLDFGIAKASNPFGETGGHNLTSTKSMLGSPLYMSPEQLRSAKNVDARADIWAIGVILYELLTGTVPFNGETLGELFIAILEQPPPPVVQRRGDVPQALSDAVMRCLMRPPEQRFQNVAELAVALASCAPPRSYVSVERVSQALGMPKPPTVSPDMRGPTGSFPGLGQHPLSSSQSGPQPAAFSSSQSGTQPNAFSSSQSGQRPFMPQAGTQMLGSQTANPAWGNTAGGTATKSKMPLIIGAALGGLVFVGVAGAGITMALKGHSAKPTASEAPPTPTTEQTAEPKPVTTETAKTAETAKPATTETAKVEPQNTTTTTTTNVQTGHRPGGHTGGGDPWGRGGTTTTTATAATNNNTTPPPHPTSTAFDPLSVGRRGN